MGRPSKNYLNLIIFPIFFVFARLWVSVFSHPDHVDWKIGYCWEAYVMFSWSQHTFGLTEVGNLLKKIPKSDIMNEMTDFIVFPWLWVSVFSHPGHVDWKVGYCWEAYVMFSWSQHTFGLTEVGNFLKKIPKSDIMNEMTDFVNNWLWSNLTENRTFLTFLDVKYIIIVMWCNINWNEEGITGPYADSRFLKNESSPADLRKCFIVKDSWLCKA